MARELEIRPMTRAEVDELVGWAAGEGWNPGLHDAEIFWRTDPDAFVAAQLDHSMIGGGAITAYGGAFGFMGLFILRPEYRGRGFGDRLWHARLEWLRSRLDEGATIGLDGVFDMQSYYAKGGFVFSHRNMRFRVDVPAAVTDETAAASNGEPNTNGREPAVVPLTDVPFDAVLAYDRTCFPGERASFLQPWISQPDARALGVLENGELKGYGVVRRCGEGCKIGPLFANDRRVAEALYAGMEGFAAGGPLFLDAPENNTAAMDLVRRHGMREVFGCARMYLGTFPEIVHERVFGVTTFELG